MTLRLPLAARSDVKIKLVKSFCRDVSIFSNIDVEDEDMQSSLCRRMQLRDAEPHEMIFAQGSSGDTAFCVMSGSVQLAVNGRHIRSIKFGECFCFSALHGAQVRPAAAVATEKTALLTLSRASYLECCNSLLQEATQWLRLPVHDRSEADIELLRSAMHQTAWFARLHYTEPQRHACRCLTLKEVGSGELVFESGDAGELFYFILAGAVAIIIDGEETEQLGTSASFGEMALLGDTRAERRRDATVIAKEPCIFAVMDRADFVKVIQGFEESVAEILLLPPNSRSDEHLQWLASMFGELSFFKDLQVDVARQAALRYLQLEGWSAKHELFHAGQPGDKLYIIVHGEVKVMEGGVKSPMEEVDRLVAGSAFGERGITADRPENRVRTSTVFTTQRCMLATLARDAYVFVTEIAKMKPLMDKFWKLAAGDDAWSEDAKLPPFINFASFRQLQLRVDIVFSREPPARISTNSLGSDASAPPDRISTNSLGSDVSVDGHEPEDAEDAVLNKWKRLVGIDSGPIQSQVLGYDKFASSFFGLFYAFLGDIEVPSLYQQCISLTLQTISNDESTEHTEVLVLKEMSAVASQRKLLKHYKAKSQKVEAAMRLANHKTEQKHNKEQKLLQFMLGADNGLDDEDNEELEQHKGDGRLRFKHAGATVLDHVFSKRLESEPTVSLHTVVAAAHARSTMVKHEEAIEKRGLSRRQRALAVNSGAQIDSGATSYHSHTESSVDIHSSTPVKKANWSKTAKWEPKETGVRNFDKDPVQPRYLMPNSAAAEATATVRFTSKVRPPLSPLPRRLYEIQPGGSGTSMDEIGIYRMPADKHARATGGVHENRARYAGDLGGIQHQGHLSALWHGGGHDASQLAGRPLASNCNHAVRTVVHNGRSTATDLVQSQQRSSGRFDYAVGVESPLRPHASIGRRSPNSRRPTEQHNPIFIPETIGSLEALQKGLSTTPSPSRNRRQPSPSHATAPVVLAEMARHQKFMREKTPWTGGGFRRPNDPDDLALLYGKLHGVGALVSADYPVVLGGPYVFAQAARDLRLQTRPSSITSDEAQPNAPNTPSRSTPWGVFGHSQTPWGEADDDLLHETEETQPVSF